MCAYDFPYFTGQTSTFAFRGDSRFSYCLYVPKAMQQRTTPARMLLAIHGTDRRNQKLRDLFSEFAEATNTLVVAPLFPAGLVAPDDIDAYKYLRVGGFAFDEIALAIVAEVTERYGVPTQPFSVFGFSGGAHFAHRLYYAHPRKLSSVVVGAPGSVTLPDGDRPWWIGLEDFAQHFGARPDWESIKRVPIHLVVGADDRDPNGIVQSSSHPFWMKGAEIAGANRVERLRTLHQRLAAAGCRVSHEELPGTGHRVEPLVQAACAFFASV